MSNEAGVLFTKTAAQRIADVVKAVEGQPDRVGSGERGRTGAPMRQCVRGKLDGALNQGGSATLSVWYYNGTSEVDSGEDITVYDWFLKSGSIASGRKVKADLDLASGRYYVTAAECP